MFPHTGSFRQRSISTGEKRNLKGPQKSLAQKLPKKDITETEILILHFIYMANLHYKHRLLTSATHDLAAQADLSPKPHPEALQRTSAGRFNLLLEKQNQHKPSWRSTAPHLSLMIVSPSEEKPWSSTHVGFIIKQYLCKYYKSCNCSAGKIMLDTERENE